MTSSLKNLFHEAASGIRRATSAGAGYWTLSILCVQGSAYLAQLVLARLVSTEDFGAVRTAESYLSIFLIPAALGIPSATARLAAAHPEEERRRSVLSQAVMLVLITSALSAGACAVFSMLFSRFRPSPALGYLPWLAPTIVFTAVTRVLLGYRQGRLELKTAAFQAMVPALALVPLLVLFVRWHELRGWIETRWIVEAGGMALTAFFLRSHLRFRWDRGMAKPLMIFAGMAALSLVLDRLFANADLLVLDQVSADRSVVGAYGAAGLLTSALLLPAGAINNVAYAEIAKIAGDRAATAKRLRTLLLASLAVTVPLAAALAAGNGLWLTLLFGPGYALPWAVIPILGAALVVQSIVLCLGTFLFAVDRPGLTVAANAAGIVAMGALCAVLIPRHGAMGAAISCALGSLVRLLAFAAAARRFFARGGP